MADDIASGALAGGAAGASVGTTINPGYGTAIGAVVGAVAGGVAAGIKDSAARKAAKAKQRAKDRWLDARRSLAKALSDNYLKEGADKQKGTTNQLEALASGSAAAEAAASVPDMQIDPLTKTESIDPAFLAAYARRGATEVDISNSGIRADQAATKRARFAQALDNQESNAAAPARYRGTRYSRERFKNALAVNEADAAFERDFGDTPNSTYNAELFGQILQGVGIAANAYAGSRGKADAKALNNTPSTTPDW
jgi:hypothetical protein